MSRQPRPNLRRTAHFLRTLLFPPRCIACSDLLHPCTPIGEVFCPLCRTAWECAVTEASAQASADAARGLAYLVCYRSGQTDGVTERTIYHLKHQGNPRAFAFVAERLAVRVREATETMPTQAPLSEEAHPLLFTYPPRRRAAVRKDGFDQAERLARALAIACEGEFASLIRRTRRGRQEQKRLDAAERADNAALAYELADVDPSILRDRIVVLCDDLRTTGATLNRCAELLIRAGARGVILSTVAVTAPDRDDETEDTYVSL